MPRSSRLDSRPYAAVARGYPTEDGRGAVYDRAMKRLFVATLLAACGAPDPTPAGTTPTTPVGCTFAGLSEWVEQEPLPSPRESFGLVAWEGWVYAVGGWTGGGATDEIVAAELGADGTIGRWTAAGTLPSPLEHAGVVVADGELWVVGGDDGVAPLVDTWHAPLDAGTVGELVAGPALPLPLVEPAAVVDPAGRIVVLGGSDGFGPDTDSALRLEAGEWQAQEPLPAALSFAGAAVLGDEIVLAGGSSREVADDRVWTWTEDGGWSRLGALPSPVLATGVDVVAGSLVVTGGLVDWTEPTAKVVSSGDGASFTTEQRLPGDRFGHGSVAVDGFVVVAGGWVSFGALQDSVAVATACPP